MLSIQRFDQQTPSSRDLQHHRVCNDGQRNIDGNRQLINKLLNDLERMKQDIEWYKRTYEKRTLFGVIKERLKFF